MGGAKVCSLSSPGHVERLFALRELLCLPKLEDSEGGIWTLPLEDESQLYLEAGILCQMLMAEIPLQPGFEPTAIGLEETPVDYGLRAARSLIPGFPVEAMTPDLGVRSLFGGTACLPVSPTSTTEGGGDRPSYFGSLFARSAHIESILSEEGPDCNAIRLVAGVALNRFSFSSPDVHRLSSLADAQKRDNQLLLYLALLAAPSAVTHALGKLLELVSRGVDGETTPTAVSKQSEPSPSSSSSPTSTTLADEFASTLGFWSSIAVMLEAAITRREMDTTECSDVYSKHISNLLDVMVPNDSSVELKRQCLDLFLTASSPNKSPHHQHTTECINFGMRHSESLVAWAISPLLIVACQHSWSSISTPVIANTIIKPLRRLLETTDYAVNQHTAPVLVLGSILASELRCCLIGQGAVQRETPGAGLELWSEEHKGVIDGLQNYWRSACQRQTLISRSSSSQSMDLSLVAAVYSIGIEHSRHPAGDVYLEGFDQFAHIFEEPFETDLSFSTSISTSVSAFKAAWLLFTGTLTPKSVRTRLVPHPPYRPASISWRCRKAQLAKASKMWPRCLAVCEKGLDVKERLFWLTAVYYHTLGVKRFSKFAATRRGILSHIRKVWAADASQLLRTERQNAATARITNWVPSVIREVVIEEVTVSIPAFPDWNDRLQIELYARLNDMGI
eukprot:gnl/Dysnectes_brevis/6651_a10490_344.p1 GENE.gnl/Dysnectes_brevis/6651_a10490_344~~gnl/Dysnectes_brevis/6651_a10490_344.p1  ORF type:complete len:712 (-),score=77.96 gnl/Dysnectes_brevis/6651_a10490_344:23-2053(-)